jgi:hypothetical protein
MTLDNKQIEATEDEREGAQMIAVFMAAARAIEKLDDKSRIRAVRALAVMFGVESVKP